MRPVIYNYISIAHYLLLIPRMIDNGCTSPKGMNEITTIAYLYLWDELNGFVCHRQIPIDDTHEGGKAGVVA